ncbi:GGDEF domain-containing protein, partial [Erysipelatoclostridium ramosum]|nr:GGDEF domain-containing protein [Thomasclavelia ramosa]
QRENKSGEIRFYEVGAHAYWVNDILHIIGVTRSVRTMEERLERVLHEQEKFDLLLSMANMYIWEYDVGKRE